MNKLYLGNIPELLDCEGGTGGVVSYPAQLANEPLSLHRDKKKKNITRHHNFVITCLNLYRILHCHRFLLVGLLVTSTAHIQFKVRTVYIHCTLEYSLSKLGHPTPL